MPSRWMEYDAWKTDPDWGRPIEDIKREEREEAFRIGIDERIWQAIEDLGFELDNRSETLLMQFCEAVADHQLELEEEAEWDGV